MNFWYKTAAIGTGLFIISIFFHRVYKLSILHWTKMLNCVMCWFDLVHESMKWRIVESVWQFTTLSHSDLHALILQDLNKAHCKCIFPYTMLLDHKLSHLFEIFEQFNIYTHNTVFQWAVQSTEYSDLYAFPTCIVI